MVRQVALWYGAPLPPNGAAHTRVPKRRANSIAPNERPSTTRPISAHQCCRWLCCFPLVSLCLGGSLVQAQVQPKLPAAIVEKCRADLARRLNVDLGSVTVRSAADAAWA